MIRNNACKSNANIKCGSLILSNEVIKNKQINKNKKRTTGHMHVTHIDEKNNNIINRK